MIKKHGDAKINDYILQNNPPPDKSKGEVKDVMQAWKRTFKHRGWDRICTISKGDFNTPYALFKEKNIRDPKVRAEKWVKGRPISPGTKHPMRTLLGKAGRAWYFLAMNNPWEKLLIPW